MVRTVLSLWRARAQSQVKKLKFHTLFIGAKIKKKKVKGTRGTHPCKNSQYVSRKAELKLKRDYGSKDINLFTQKLILEVGKVTKECIKPEDSTLIKRTVAESYEKLEENHKNDR